MKTRIKIDDKADRDAIALPLLRNGYTVRYGRVKGKSGKWEHYVEYWQGGKEGE